MGRRLRTPLPVHPKNLYPNVQPKECQTVEVKERLYRLNQQLSFNKGHRAVELPALILVTMCGKGSRSTWPYSGENRATLLLFCGYQQGHTPKRPLCLGGHNQTPCNKTFHRRPAFRNHYCPQPNSAVTNSTITAVAAGTTETNGRTSDGDNLRDSPCC